MILFDDFNAYSLMWNPLILMRIKVGLLKRIIKNYSLILNNESGVIIRSSMRNNKSIIDLTFTSMSMGLLESWLIEEEYSTSFNHELIVFKWLDFNINQSKAYN